MMKTFVLLVVVFHASVTRAETSPPWAIGVSEAAQNRANALFDEANTLFAQQAYPAALERYEAAVALWDHPRIRYDMAVTLLRLDRELEAADAFDAALRFGATPFTDDVYEHAKEYRRELKKKIGELEISCTQADVSVLLDGQPWLACPGTKRRRLLPGTHSVVAEGPHFVTLARRITIRGGRKTDVDVTLSPPRDQRVLVTKTRWTPWIIAGLGVATAGAGATTWFLGYRERGRADDLFQTSCMAGCDRRGETYASVTSMRNTASRDQRIGAGLLVGGGVLVVTGVVWALVARTSRTMPAVDVAPTRDGLRASVGWQF